jgi:ribonucleotide reductase beta subunit family protein with ferritin-like domain
LETIPIIKLINEWGLKYSEGDYPISIKILVFICFEGIMFSGAFAFVYWLKFVYFQGKSSLKGFIKSNELISRDESFHVDFGVELFSETNLTDNIHAEQIKDIIRECVYLTTKFNEEAIQIKYTGMNNISMSEYTKYMADRILVQLGFEKIYRNTNPFTFMNTIGMVQKTNFHESRPTEYQKAIKSDFDDSFTDDF